MDCRRAEELLSDHHEGTLAEPLLSELERHLGECGACATLRRALGEVVEALRASPALEPPAGLAERAARAALARSRPRPRREQPVVRLPSWLQAAAAGFALVATGIVLLAAGSEGPRRAVTRMLERSANTGAYLVEQKDRLIEDVRILGVVISTTFEGRLDRMTDRVDDYRRLLERRRLNEQEEKKNRGSNATSAGGRLARAARDLRTRPSLNT